LKIYAFHGLGFMSLFFALPIPSKIELQG